MVQWVDVQNDGFLDLVTIGADSLGELGMRVFLNDSTYELLLSSSWSKIWILVQPLAHLNLVILMMMAFLILH